MKLQLSSAGALNVFTGYGEGYVLVNNVRHERNLLVLPERVIPWDVAGFESLREEDFSELAAMRLEIVLLGTGAKQRFPEPRLTRPLAQARVGIEVMDLMAACRTYNILVSESRLVAAALLFA